MINYNKIILWGHKLHTHTHSYIHFGFYRAFKHLGYDVLWLDEDDDLNIDLSNSLFITEGQVDKNIPLLEDCTYILHNCNGDKYKNIKKKYNMQVITKTSLNTYNFKKLSDYAFYCGDCFTICWATDLLPEEIDININKVKNDEIISKKQLNFIGLPTGPWDDVLIWCINNDIKYTRYGGFGNNIDMDTHIKLIQESIIAPAIQEEWQVENGYIPCRIFKNISYGKMGITNNSFVNELFNNELIYDTDIHKLLDKSLQFNDKNKLIELMIYVRDNHTYINRIYSLFEFLELFI